MLELLDVSGNRSTRSTVFLWYTRSWPRLSQLFLKDVLITHQTLSSKRFLPNFAAWLNQDVYLDALYLSGAKLWPESLELLLGRLPTLKQLDVSQCFDDEGWVRAEALRRNPKLEIRCTARRPVVF